MKRMRLVFIVCISVFLIAASNATVEYPELTSWVNDYAGVLSEEEQQALDKILQDFEDRTTSQIFVGILDKLPSGISLEDYVLELFNNHWQPGQKDKDNGVLFIIFIEDRKLRISVGYGFEEILTNEICKKIIDSDIVPAFRQGNYYQGIKNGVESIITIVNEQQ